MNLGTLRAFRIGATRGWWRGGWWIDYQLRRWKLQLVCIDLNSYPNFKDMPLHRGSSNRAIRQDIYHVWRFELAIDMPRGDKGQTRYDEGVRILRARRRQNIEKARARTEALKADINAMTDPEERRDLERKLFYSALELYKCIETAIDSTTDPEERKELQRKLYDSELERHRYFEKAVEDYDREHIDVD